MSKIPRKLNAPNDSPEVKDDVKVSVYLVSAQCLIHETRHHLKIAAYSRKDALDIATAMDVDAVVVDDIEYPKRTDNQRLMAYVRGDIDIFQNKK